MPRREILVCNARHYDEPPALLAAAPAAYRRLRDHVTSIIESLSQGDHGEIIITRVRCWKRPERHPCPGSIVGALTSNDELRWECSACPLAGIVYQWQASPWDWSGREITPRRSRLASRALKVHLTLAERRLLIDDILPFRLDAGDARHLLDQEIDPDGATLTGTYDQLALLRGLIADEANGFMRVVEERIGHPVIQPPPDSMAERLTALFHKVHRAIAW
jgi:hypothetical protein